jgi:hypothetical protein
LTNEAIEEDAEKPKEAQHLDYKYIKSYEGPLTQSQYPRNRKSPIRIQGANVENEAADDEEKQKLVDKHRETKRKRGEKKQKKIVYSFERKKYGGIRMC